MEHLSTEAAIKRHDRAEEMAKYFQWQRGAIEFDGRQYLGIDDGKTILQLPVLSEPSALDLHDPKPDPNHVGNVGMYLAQLEVLLNGKAHINWTYGLVEGLYQPTLCRLGLVLLDTNVVSFFPLVEAETLDQAITKAFYLYNRDILKKD